MPAMSKIRLLLKHSYAIRSVVQDPVTILLAYKCSSLFLTEKCRTSVIIILNMSSDLDAHKERELDQSGTSKLLRYEM